MMRRTLCAWLIGLVIASMAMAWVAVGQYPAIWRQPGARMYVVEAESVLLVYLVVLVWIALRREPWWDGAAGVAAVFGGASACVEIVNVASESGLLPTADWAAAPLGFMLCMFLLWGVAGWRGARALGSVWRGAVTAALSAGVCMVIGVAAGFAMELFLAPPDPAGVASWGEYLRSGWTDTRAFAIANTLDSGWTHLVVGPVIGVLFGSVGAWLGRVRLRRAGAIA